MKKVFLALGIVSVFAACNDSKTDSTTTSDSTNVKVDSSAVTPMTTDTSSTRLADTSANKMKTDTIKKK